MLTTKTHLSASGRPAPKGCALGRAMAGTWLGEGNMAGSQPQLTQSPCYSAQPGQLYMVALVIFNIHLLR